jgi:DNA anti-recombination protein RmuC
MTAKRPRTSRTDKRLALSKRLVRIRAEVSKLKHDRAAVRRDEFEEMSKSLRQLHKNTDDLVEHTKNLATQLTRISQIQQEVDAIKRILATWAKVSD